MIDNLRPFPAVKTLNFVDTNLGAEEMVALSEVFTRDPKPFPALETLVLDKNRLGDEGALALSRAITEQAFPQLQILHLSRNNIADAGIEALTGALGTHCPHLKRLDLGDNLCYFRGATALSRMFPTLPNLEDLVLNDFFMTHGGMQVFCEALEDPDAFPALENLSLGSYRLTYNTQPLIDALHTPGALPSLVELDYQVPWHIDSARRIEEKVKKAMSYHHELRKQEFLLRAVAKQDIAQHPANQALEETRRRTGVMFTPPPVTRKRSADGTEKEPDDTVLRDTLRYSLTRMKPVPFRQMLDFMGPLTHKGDDPNMFRPPPPPPPPPPGPATGPGGKGKTRRKKRTWKRLQK